MFEGYDPERRPPYTQEVYREINGKRYRIVWSVSNGYGGSILISSGPMEEVLNEDKESTYRQ